MTFNYRLLNDYFLTIYIQYQLIQRLENKKTSKIRCNKNASFASKKYRESKNETETDETFFFRIVKITHTNKKNY